MGTAPSPNKEGSIPGHRHVGSSSHGASPWKNALCVDRVMNISKRKSVSGVTAGAAMATAGRKAKTAGLGRELKTHLSTLVYIRDVSFQSNLETQSMP